MFKLSRFLLLVFQMLYACVSSFMYSLHKLKDICSYFTRQILVIFIADMSCI